VLAGFRSGSAANALGGSGAAAIAVAFGSDVVWAHPELAPPTD